jgi:hypothetical protein
MQINLLQILYTLHRTLSANWQETLFWVAMAMLVIAILLLRIALKRERRQTRILKTYAPYLFLTEVQRHGSGRGGRNMDTKKNYVQRARAGLPHLQSVQGMMSGLSPKERERLSLALGPEQVRAIQQAIAQEAEAILKRREIGTRSTLYLDKVDAANLTIPAVIQSVGDTLITVGEMAKGIEAQLPPALKVVFQAVQAQCVEHLLTEASLGTSGFGFNVKELYLAALNTLSNAASRTGPIIVETAQANTNTDGDWLNEHDDPPKKEAVKAHEHRRNRF